MDEAGDLRILFGDAVFGIEQHEHDVRPPDGIQRTQNAVALDGLLLDRLFAPDAGGIDDAVGLAAEDEL